MDPKKLKIRTCMNSIEWNKYNFRVFLNFGQKCGFFQEIGRYRVNMGVPMT